jgi:nucleoprotein TPR
LQKSEREHAAQASAANNKLALSESSWKSQREALEKELNDLNTRLVVSLSI